MLTIKKPLADVCFAAIAKVASARRLNYLGETLLRTRFIDRFSGLQFLARDRRSPDKSTAVISETP